MSTLDANESAAKSRRLAEAELAEILGCVVGSKVKWCALGTTQKEGLYIYLSSFLCFNL